MCYTDNGTKQALAFLFQAKTKQNTIKTTKTQNKKQRNKTKQGMSEQLMVRLTKQNKSREMYLPIRRHTRKN